MDELAARRAQKEAQQLDAIVGNLCLSVPEWLVKRMGKTMQDEVFSLIVEEAKDRIKRPAKV